MNKTFLLEQLDKLFDHKTILVLNEDDLENLILIAVPGLLADADELERTGSVFQARKLRALARELDNVPKPTNTPHIINLSDHVH
jgi:hypothetical protein